MTPALEPAQADPHTVTTGLVHVGLALAVVAQLAASPVLQGPTETSAGNAVFQMHRQSGFTVLALPVPADTHVPATRDGGRSALSLALRRASRRLHRGPFGSPPHRLSASTAR